jgi:DNA invertase Pin-like site-specific DNA recombinase
MRIKYNRVSTIQQTGDRYQFDTEKYDLTLLDKVSGTVSFFDRPNGKKIKDLVEKGKVQELIVEEVSRIGRNTGNCIQVIGWLEEKGVNVVVKNLGIQSRPNGKKNPIWKLISSVMSSLYEMELENIKERTLSGRMVFVQKGGKLGRPVGTNVSTKEFLEKPTSKKSLEYLKKGMSVREVSKLVGVSSSTVMKVKKTGEKLGILVPQRS